MIYLTGDTHGQFDRIEDFCQANQTKIDDILIILGDVGVNYYSGKKDIRNKQRLANLTITLLCIHGNHENRAENISTYIEYDWNNHGKVLREEEYPNILFAKDGEIYCFEDKKALVIGGAYSVDKYYRLSKGYNWWADEQPSPETKKFVEQQLGHNNWKMDYVLSHTCPKKYEPTEVFLPMIDQAQVDKSTEDWLDGIEEKLFYEKWYCGHYHVDKTIDHLCFIYKSFYKLGCSSVDIVKSSIL